MNNQPAKSERNNLEIVVDYIANLNIQGLNEVLNENYDYNDLPKKQFIKLLNGVFTKLKSTGANSLKVLQSFCAGCQAGARVKLFVCHETKRVLAFAIDSNEKFEVTDIFNCNKFTINNFPEYKEYTQISFDTDDNSFFEIKPFWDLPKGQ